MKLILFTIAALCAFQCFEARSVEQIDLSKQVQCALHAAKEDIQKFIPEAKKCIEDQNEECLINLIKKDLELLKTEVKDCFSNNKFEAQSVEQTDLTEKVLCLIRFVKNEYEKLIPEVKKCLADQDQECFIKLVEVEKENVKKGVQNCMSKNFYETQIDVLQNPLQCLVDAIAKISEEVRPQVVECLKSDNPINCIKDVIKNEAPEVKDAIKACLPKNVFQTRDVASENPIKCLIDAIAKISEEVRSQVIECLKSDDRVNCIKDVIKNEAPEVKDAIKACLPKNVFQTRNVASENPIQCLIDALAKISEEVRPQVVECLKSDNPITCIKDVIKNEAPEVKDAIKACLPKNVFQTRDVASENPIKCLIDAIAKISEEVRSQVIECLKGDDRVNCIKDVIKNEAPEVKDAIKACLPKNVFQTRDVASENPIQCLIDALAKISEEVRSQVIECLKSDDRVNCIKDVIKNEAPEVKDAIKACLPKNVFQTRHVASENPIKCLIDAIAKISEEVRSQVIECLKGDDRVNCIKDVIKNEAPEVKDAIKACLPKNVFQSRFVEESSYSDKNDCSIKVFEDMFERINARSDECMIDGELNSDCMDKLIMEEYSKFLADAEKCDSLASFSDNNWQIKMKCAVEKLKNQFPDLHSEIENCNNYYPCLAELKDEVAIKLIEDLNACFGIKSLDHSTYNDSLNVVFCKFRVLLENMSKLMGEVSKCGDDQDCVHETAKRLHQELADKTAECEHIED